MNGRIISEEKFSDTGYSYTLSLISGKYKPIVLYCLMEYEPVRFNEMQRYLKKVADKTLSQNLKELEADGLIVGNAGPYGMEITHVDGEKAVYNEDKAYWGVFEEEEYAMQGIDTTPVVDGAIYKLVYTLG